MSEFKTYKLSEEERKNLDNILNPEIRDYFNSYRFLVKHCDDDRIFGIVRDFLCEKPKELEILFSVPRTDQGVH